MKKPIDNFFQTRRP